MDSNDAVWADMREVVPEVYEIQERDAGARRDKGKDGGPNM